MAASSDTPLGGARSIEATFALRNLPDEQRKAYRRLLERGPLPQEEIDAFPIMTPLQRLYGLTPFRVNPTNQNLVNETRPTFGPGGSKTVYYLYYDHGPEDVIPPFFDHNPTFVETATPHSAAAVMEGHGSGWAEAARDEMKRRGAPTTR